MTTNITIIEDALRDINVIGETQSASAEQGAHALRKLNQIMEAFREGEFDFGWFSQTLTTADIPIPDYAEVGITAALSIAIAPRYGATVSSELATVAGSTLNMLKRKGIVEKQEGADMSHLPQGAGKRIRHNILTGA